VILFQKKKKKKKKKKIKFNIDGIKKGLDFGGKNKKKLQLRVPE